MIVLNIRELCKLRGIKHPHAALTKAGISNTVATDYLKKKKGRFVLEDVETLCLLLRCTPNDLFKWVPDEPKDDFPENPLQQIRQKPQMNLEEKLKNMSAEEIEKRMG